MINTPVKVEFKFTPKSKWEGPTDTWYCVVYREGKRKNGTSYPEVVEIKSATGSKGKKSLESYVMKNF